MAKAIVSQRFNTPIGRLAHPYLFAPDENEKYSAVLLFDKLTFDKSKFTEALNEIKKQLTSGTYKNGFPSTFKGDPVKDGDIPNSNGNTPFKGYYYCNVKSNFQPGIVAAYPDPSGKLKADGTPAPKIIDDENEIYAGCYVRANIHAYFYNSQGNVGIGFSLNGIQKVKDGERFVSNSAINAFDCMETEEVLASFNDDI